MKKFLENSFDKAIASSKADAAVITEHLKHPLQNKKGEYVDTTIKWLIAIVVGVLLLSVLYAFFGDTVLPKLKEKITGLFDYKG